jgi:drug/metabolite transporter (DMT)-like permease
LAALSAAALWSIASIIYGRLGEQIPPKQLNLIKGFVAIVLFLVTIVVSGEIFPDIPVISLFLLLLSGAIGIGLGDTTFFATINILGARRTLLIGTLVPVMTSLGGIVFLKESLNISGWLGILLTILGVAWVITERVPNREDWQKNQVAWGIVLGLFTVLTNAIGSLFARAALANTNINPVWAGLLRLSAGEVVLVLWLWWGFVRRQGISTAHPNKNSYWRSPRIITTTFIAGFLGTYLGIWLQQTALKLSNVGVATTLMQASPLFVIPLTMWMGEKVTYRGIIGVAIALFGIGMLFSLK